MAPCSPRSWRWPRRGEGEEKGRGRKRGRGKRDQGAGERERNGQVWEGRIYGRERTWEKGEVREGKKMTGKE